MARPIWNGTLSFGLLNIPVQLMPGEKRVDLSFRMLDARNKSPIRYERVNAETGEEVPWKDIVKAYEFEKGNYVVLQESDFKAASPEGREAIEVEGFVALDSIPRAYFEKPYVLVPAKKAEKGYVLLRETLRKMDKVGIARVVIRTREYLAAVMADGDALMLNLLRYPQELVPADEYKIPEGKVASYRISAKELEMASHLIESMSTEFDPDAYHDEFRKRLHTVIDKRIKAGGKVARKQEVAEAPEGAATNVVDFMSLLQKSLATNKRTPAKAAAKKTSRKRTGKPAAKKASGSQRPRSRRKAG